LLRLPDWLLFRRKADHWCHSKLRTATENDMAKRKRRTPRYKREDPVFQEGEAKRAAGVPADALLADLGQQAPNNSYGPPRYYQDREFTCVDCGRQEIWTAAQQKWWYEVAKGSIYSGANRCRACRAALRTAHRGTPRRSQADRNLLRDSNRVPNQDSI